MWPFAKLLNGFSSHRYLYSPTLLDSQEANANYLPHGYSCTRLVWAAPYLLPYGIGNEGRQWRMEILVSFSSCQGATGSSYWILLYVASAMENGKGNSPPESTLQGTLVTVLYTVVLWQWTMENGERNSKICGVPPLRGSEA